MNFRLHVKTAFLQNTASEIPASSPSVLLGVTDAAASALAELNVRTVYDLALSTIFANATRVVAAAADSNSVINKHGKPPADIIDHSALSTPLADVPTSPIQLLVGIGPVNGPSIANALGVESVRDLAQWPPYLAAKNLLVAALTPERAADYDREAPSDLIPRSGRFATQRIGYTTVALLKSTAMKMIPWDGGLMDTTVLDAVGFGDIAFGAVLGFSQTWKPRAVALGNLLHSLPLAPGESTKITMMDWVRRSKGTSTEDIEQAESLSSALSQSTAISEVTSAVAKEVQEGDSTSSAGSSSSSAGGVALIPSFGFGGGGGSTNSSSAATYTRRYLARLCESDSHELTRLKQVA